MPINASGKDVTQFSIIKPVQTYTSHLKHFLTLLYFLQTFYEKTCESPFFPTKESQSQISHSFSFPEENSAKNIKSIIFTEIFSQQRQ